MGDAKRRREHQGERMMPTFAFFRRHDIEQEVGLILAGNLIVDIPKDRKSPLPHEQQMITEILQKLTDGARSGEMPDDAVIYGWPGGHRPEDDSIIDDDAALTAWAKERITIAVRVDPRNDDLVRVDSETLLQMGLIKQQ